MYTGSHVSIKGGYLQAAKRAHQIGAKAFQYFPKNPRSLQLKAFDEHDAKACATWCRERGMLSIAHSPYPTNMALDEGEHKNLIVQSLINDLSIAETCGSIGLVVHFGKYKGKDPLQGYKNSLQCLNEVLSIWEGKALLLIENQAGDGTSMGTRLEELVQLRQLSPYAEKIGFCFDTCHAFASGLWTEDNWFQLAEHGARLGYFEHVKAVHLNDSMYPAGACRDRHANVGRGYIGKQRIKQLLEASWLRHIPIILETPETSDYTHQQELKDVHRLLQEEGEIQ